MKLEALCDLIVCGVRVDAGSAFEADDDNAARLIKRRRAKAAAKKRKPKDSDPAQE